MSRPNHLRAPLTALAIALAAACDEPAGLPRAPRPDPAQNETGPVPLALDTLETGLTRPVFVTAPPGDRRRLFIVEQTGRVLLRLDGVLRATPFLDLTGQVSGGNEQGLLGLAFHPDYATNGRFFVDYTDLAGDTRVVEYARSNPNRANPASARELLFVDQPRPNHNGGMLAFGPDGYLYVALGDGGSMQGPNAQRLDNLLGKILRIDVDGALPYAIPADNPFADSAGARPEIWHYGLRHPWRFSFDRRTGRMIIGDVGQNAFEEIDVVNTTGGVNFGWPVVEGPACFPADPCSRRGLRAPVLWYAHDPACAVTAGYAYRGRELAGHHGAIFFVDHCAGVVQSFLRRAGSTTDPTDWSPQVGIVQRVSSFGEDARGELYMTTIHGLLLRFVPRS